MPHDNATSAIREPMLSLKCHSSVVDGDIRFATSMNKGPVTVVEEDEPF